MTYVYSLYGLTVTSDFELRGLRGEASGTNVVRVRRASIKDPLIADRDPFVFVSRDRRQLLAWAAVGAFIVPSDDLIEVDANVGVPDSLVSLPLLGAVMATLLHRRGLFVLHASAVAVGGQAIALLGDKGAGKSTTAGALVAAGHTLISDDIVAVDFKTPRVDVLPACGELKLWPDSGERLGREGLNRIGPIHARIDKANYAAPCSTGAPTRLSRLYLLERGVDFRIERPRNTDALAALLRHGYMARFGSKGYGGDLPAYFERAAMLADRVRTLTVPPDFDRLMQINRCIEADIKRGGREDALSAAS